MFNSNSDCTSQNQFSISDSDRKIKYGYGSLRLLFILSLFLWLSYSYISNSKTKFSIGTTLVRYGIFGIGGGLLNLHKLKLSLPFQLLILVILIGNFIHEYLNSSNVGKAVLLMYFFKTLIGDGLAGKLDNVIWFKSLLIAGILWTICSSQLIQINLLPNFSQVIELLVARPKLPVFLAHLASHWFCELGDNWGEKWIVFRHRYSYEAACILLWFLIENDISRILTISDMSAALFYRVTNYCYTLKYSYKINTN